MILVASSALIIAIIGAVFQLRRSGRTEPEDATLLDYTGFISWSVIIITAVASLALQITKIQI